MIKPPFVVTFFFVASFFEALATVFFRGFISWMLTSSPLSPAGLRGGLPSGRVVRGIGWTR